MSTPIKATPVKETAATDSPGTWRHPRIDEITRRRNATAFSEKNVRKIAYNVATLLGLWFLRLLVLMQFGSVVLPADFRLYLSWAWFAAQAVPFAQIALACLPLMRKTDDISDIPLTPTQRKLLGLPPSSTKAQPDTVYSTPPRYSRTPSNAGSVGSRNSYASSPLSGRGSAALTPLFGESGSPQGSPLFHKSTSGLGNGRRSSLTGSPFGASTSTGLFSDPASPGSPSGGKRTSVGLNSKWLYEKGRRSSGGAWAY